MKFSSQVVKKQNLNHITHDSKKALDTPLLSEIAEQKLPFLYQDGAETSGKSTTKGV